MICDLMEPYRNLVAGVLLQTLEDLALDKTDKIDRTGGSYAHWHNDAEDFCRGRWCPWWCAWSGVPVGDFRRRANAVLEEFSNEQLYP